MSKPARAAKGLLLAMMEPPPAIEEEFQQWYDTEHFPERADCEGFETATRLICIDGWPKYLALYDLTGVDVLRGPGYAAIAGEKYSMWTHRIISKVWGQYRAEGVQIYPGQALLGQKGAFARVILWRFRRVPKKHQGQLVQNLRATFEHSPTTAQLRVFVSKQPDGTDYLCVIESRAVGSAASPDTAALGAIGQYVDLCNVYVPYYRQSAGAFPKSV